MILRQPQTPDDFVRYYHLRWEILRAPWGQPKGSEKDNFENSAFHLMAETNSHLIGIGRLHSIDQTTSQIRYMAVCRDKQRRGVGRSILTTLEKHAVSENKQSIILNARTSIIEFYLKQGYRMLEDAGTLFGCIKHKKLIKHLS